MFSSYRDVRPGGGRETGVECVASVIEVRRCDRLLFLVNHRGLLESLFEVRLLPNSLKSHFSLSLVELVHHIIDFLMLQGFRLAFPLHCFSIVLERPAWHISQSASCNIHLSFVPLLFLQIPN